MVNTKITVALLGGVVLGLSSAPAWAQNPSCNTLTNPLYLQIGDTQEPLIKSLGLKLVHSSTHPITLVYITSGSCTNIEAIYAGTKITTNPSYIPTSTSWTTSMASPSCTIDPAGHAIDVANSALFVSACNPPTMPPNIAQFPGPIQAYVFIVPTASTQVAITAEEAYFVFGFGAAGMAMPWLDPTYYYIRPTTKSTVLSIAANIGVPASKWQGQKLDKSTQVLSSVAMSAMAEKTIGILGAEVYDANRGMVKSLAYRAYHQWFAYYPDSTPTSTDKQNVRDGHYTMWAPTVWMTQVNGGVPTSSTAKYVIDLITTQDNSETTEFKPLDVVISKGLIPSCAMKVTRSMEGGDLSLAMPDKPCGCYYQSKVPGGSSAGCTTCQDDSACGGGKCRLGFCEAR
jgi:hypothetical protein